MDSNKEETQDLLLLFDRPQEPIFIPKGTEDTIFEVPLNSLPERLKPGAIQNRFGEMAKKRIQVNELASPPNLDAIMELGRRENFTLFFPKHQRIAAKLIEIFLEPMTIKDLIAVAIYVRERVNPYLFNYALSVAMLNRNDTGPNADLPSFLFSFPDKFVDSKVFGQAREEANIVPQGSRTPIEIPRDFTASDLEEEHRLAYFREDLGVNLHHWHWHLVYPNYGRREFVDKNRRGELFFYMHEQIIARYNFERLCNNLKRTARLINLHDPIPEAYFPKMSSLVAGQSWPGRPANQVLTSVNRPADGTKVDIKDMELWKNRVVDAIESGFVMDAQGNKIMLTENEGIDILGNIVESSSLSINPDFYGNLHGMGHVMLSSIHDPDFRHKERVAVMGDTAVAMRDPVFYRWHAYIDSLFQKFKESLPRYGPAQLNYNGITVDKVEVNTEGTDPNMFNTFWQQSDINMSRGLDFQPNGSLFVRVTHLQHQPFSYNITVNNQGNMRMGTCRIFIAPKNDEKGNPWLFRDQRTMFVELDKFAVSLKSGRNTITRNSTQSSVTIPFERVFRTLDRTRSLQGEELRQFNFCGCGWPAHMLLPKGTPEGFLAQLFVMISNYEDDKVEQKAEGICNDAYSYCGIKDKLYPDRRSMGYPFDRAPRRDVSTLQDFLTSNMRVQDVVIKFNDIILKKRN